MHALVVGISGPSSSGKTSLTRLLRELLQQAGHNVLVIHEDDFYLTDKDIPIHKGTGLQDWDCLESIDVPAFQAALRYIKEHGELPDSLSSQQHLNAFRKPEISEALASDIEREAKELPQSTIVLVDGFLLYPPALRALYELMDLRLFLPLTRELMITRRANRTGYVTIEGFWEDPPRYVEDVVWPNYANDHAFLFEHGDVEGTIKQSALNEIKVKAAPAAAMEDMTKSLQWAWSELKTLLTAV